VFGLKPTRARTPMGPDRGEGWGGFSCGNCVSISVRDSAAILDAIQGPEPCGPYQVLAPERPYLEEVAREPGRLRIAFTDRTPAGAPVDPEVAAAVRDVAKMLEGLGHHVEERAPKLPVDSFKVMNMIVSSNTGLSVRMAEQLFGRPMTDRDFERLTLHSYEVAKQASAIDYTEAQLGAHYITRALATFFEVVDVFLAPTLATPALRLGEIDTMAEDPTYIADVLLRYMPATPMFNISGQPAMSVPLAWNKAGMPLGMMFASRFGDEATLYRLAAQLEQARPWKGRMPGVCA
jgi:amidase